MNEPPPLLFLCKHCVSVSLLVLLLNFPFLSTRENFSDDLIILFGLDPAMLIKNIIRNASNWICMCRKRSEFGIVYGFRIDLGCYTWLVVFLEGNLKVHGL